MRWRLSANAQGCHLHFNAMKKFAEKFYKSQAWKQTRYAYMSKAGGLCEECERRGIYTPADEVHHKIALTQENISNVDIALSFDNLIALCKKCHKEKHSKNAKRFRIDEFGNVYLNDDQ